MKSTADLVAESRAAQGLPPKVEDRRTLDQVARIVVAADRRAASEEDAA